MKNTTLIIQQYTNHHHPLHTISKSNIIIISRANGGAAATANEEEDADCNANDEEKTSHPDTNPHPPGERKLGVATAAATRGTSCDELDAREISGKNESYKEKRMHSRRLQRYWLTSNSRSIVLREKSGGFVLFRLSSSSYRFCLPNLQQHARPGRSIVCCTCCTSRGRCASEAQRGPQRDLRRVLPNRCSGAYE